MKKTCGDCESFIKDEKRNITVCYQMEETEDVEDDYMHPDAEICGLFKLILQDK